MSLQLNEAGTARYKEFFGEYNTEMPKLLAEGRAPMNVADLMRRRLEVADSDEPELRQAWRESYCSTSDALLRHPSGKVKIVLDARPLLAITPEQPLRRGALILSEDAYRALPGVEYERHDLGAGRMLTKREAIKHPIWRTLARDDKSLLAEYADLAFRDAKERFGRDESMGIYMHLNTEPAAWEWSVGGFADGSHLSCGNRLDRHYSRLVGYLRAVRLSLNR